MTTSRSKLLVCIVFSGLALGACVENERAVLIVPVAGDAR